MEKQSKIEDTGNGGSMHTGEAATRRFQLVAMRSALKMEEAGLRFRGSVLAAAKRVTGLRTNNRVVHMDRLTLMIRDLEQYIEFVVARRENNNG